MKKIFSLITIAICSLLTVQADDTWLPYNIYEGDELYIYATISNVRDGAGTNTSVIDKLNCGDIVHITNVTNDRFSQSGLSGRWIGIWYTRNGARKSGYVWEGVLSPTQIRRGNVKFVYGIESGNAEEYEFKLGLKAVIETKIASTQYIDTGIRGCITAEVSDDGKGLYGVERIVTLSTASGAYGVSSAYYNFAWNGKALIPLVHGMGVDDSDYSYDAEDVIYPAQGALYNTIVKIEHGGVNKNEGDDYYDNPYTSYAEKYYKLSIYSWDGEGVKLLQSIK